MNKTTSNIKYIAAFLVAVFTVVFAVKVLHQHEGCDTLEYATATDEVAKSDNCSICDFHFTKDVEIFPVDFSLNEPVSSASFACFYQSIPTSSIGLSYADRGPPAFFPIMACIL